MAGVVWRPSGGSSKPSVSRPTTTSKPNGGGCSSCGR